MAKKDYKHLSKEIVQYVGGEENVVSLYHCITRLRFKLKDTTKADKQALEKLPEVLSVVEANGQYQVVIGNQVAEVYAEVMKQHSIKSALGTDGNPGGQESSGQEEEKQGNVFTRFLNTLSSIFNPIIMSLAGAGMLKALLVVFTTYNLMDAEGSTYLILSAAGNSVFFFLPLFLAVSSARVFKANQFIALAIVAALMEPNFTSLVTENGVTVSFAGIPAVLMSYSGTVIPAIISVYIYSKLEKVLKRFVPKSIEIFAFSLIALLIMVPLTVIVIGPVGVYLGNAIGDAMNFISNESGLLAGALIGGGWTFLVIMGVHWGIVPVMVNNLTNLGYDIIRPMIAAATFASAGAALGVFFKSKKKETKALALSSLLPALLGGVTEPIVYGLSIKLKRPLAAQVIGGAVAGAFLGAMRTKAIVYVFPALTTLPAFFGDTFVYYCIGIAGAFFLTAALTYILGFNEEGSAEIVTVNSASASANGNQLLEVTSPVTGKMIPITQVNDPVFSSKAMGDGVGIVPNAGILVAPAAGTIETVFPTGHAIGLKTSQGIEILLHIGINTVELNGDGFETKVTAGDHVEKGQVLAIFDLEEIKAKGYDPTVIMCVTNMDQVGTFTVVSPEAITDQEVMIIVESKGVMA